MAQQVKIFHFRNVVNLFRSILHIYTTMSQPKVVPKIYHTFNIFLFLADFLNIPCCPQFPDFSSTSRCIIITMNTCGELVLMACSA